MLYIRCKTLIRQDVFKRNFSFQIILTWSSQGLSFNSLVLHIQLARKQGMKKHLPGSKRRWNLLLAKAATCTCRSRSRFNQVPQMLRYGTRACSLLPSSILGADTVLANLPGPFWAVPTRGFPSMRTVTRWSYKHSSLHMPWVQKRASGTLCRWRALSFAALPGAYKMLSVSFGWISNSLSRGVKDYIRSLTYIGLNSCSRVMEQSWMEERNLEKAQQWAHACSLATPGQRLESQRRDRELCMQKSLPLASNISIQMVLPALRAGTVTFWCLCLWIPRIQVSLDLTRTARGYSNKSTAITE